MGYGGPIFLIVVGAILALAIRDNIAVLDFIDLSVVGWILMVAGAVWLGITLYVTRRRRLEAESHGEPRSRSGG